MTGGVGRDSAAKHLRLELLTKMTRQPQLVPVVQDGDIISAEPGLNLLYAVDVDDVASMYARELT